MAWRWTRSRSRQARAESSAQGEASNRAQSSDEPRAYNVDPDSDPESDGEYDPEAQPYEQEFGFSIPTRRMLHKLLNLRKRNFYHTRLFDEGTLDKLGMGREVTQLLMGIGFTYPFCRIRERAYRNLTIEFLSSLRLKTGENGHQYIKFRMVDETRRVFLSDLAEHFGLMIEDTADALEFRWGESRDTLWMRLTGSGQTHGYKASWIQHPSIRVLHRILVSTIYARGETMARLNVEDAVLLDNILRDAPTKVNLTFLMVQHWIGITANLTDNGYITMGSYVTHIAKKLGVTFDTGSLCTGSTILNINMLKRYGFIEIVGSRGGERYKWIVQNQPSFYLPYPNNIVPSRPETWLIPAGYNPDPPEEQDFMDMFSQGHHSGSHSAGPSRTRGRTGASSSGGSSSTSRNYHMSPLESLDYLIESMETLCRDSTETRADMKELHRKSDETRAEVRANTEKLDRLDKRLATREDEWEFYKQHGYIRGGPHDPNMMHDEPLPPPPQSPHEQPPYVPPYNPQQPPPPGGPYDPFYGF